MKIRASLYTIALLALAACSGQQPAEKAILGEWEQDIPTSTTDGSLEATTSETRLEFEKDGDVRLRRQLDLAGPGLPIEGVSLDVSLSGEWRLEGETLIQTLTNAAVTARDEGDVARQIADDLQAQAIQSTEARKTIIALDRDRLILQDLETGTTDSYKRR